MIQVIISTAPALLPAIALPARSLRKFCYPRRSKAFVGTGIHPPANVLPGFGPQALES